jgi:glycerophosphoryl diester phosphodiesterase
MARSHGPHTVKTPQIMSHRGDLRSHPENSLAALENVLAAGIRHLECDIQINASGTPVLLHDPNLLRTFAVDRSVFEHADGQSPSLPVLADVLDLADRYPETVLYLEIKYDSLERWGETFVLDRLLPWSERIKQHVLLASSKSFLSLARETGLPRIGVNLRDWSAVNHEQLAALQPDLLVVNVQRVPDGENLWPGSWQWAVYEVEDIATALHWGERGAHFVLSHVGVELHQQRQALN